MKNANASRVQNAERFNIKAGGVVVHIVTNVL
jgi:hypothetical protein